MHAPDRMEASRRVLDNNLAAHPSLQILFLRADTPSAPINNFQEGTNNFYFRILFKGKHIAKYIKIENFTISLL